MAHEMGHFVERFTIVVQKNAGIHTGMNDQKDQKQAGKAHEKFFTDRRSKKSFQVIWQYVVRNTEE